MISKVRLDDLDCADCAGKLERTITGLPGVQSVKLNFFLSRMEVNHQLSEPALLEAIGEAGHKPTLISDSQFHGAAEPNDSVSYQVHALAAVGLGIIGLLLQPVVLIAAMVVGGWKTYQKAWRSLLGRRLDMNVLMSTAIIGAVIIGEWEEGALVAVLFAISQWLEHHSMEQTRQSVQSLMETAPPEAVVLRDGRERRVRVTELTVGEHVVTKSGSRIPVDGMIRTGHSFVNQAAITGESVPVEKRPGDEVYAGTVNENGLLVVEMTKLPQESMLAKIAQLVEDAQSQKTPVQAFVDRFAAYYTPAVLALALAAAILGPVVGLSWNDSIYRALSLLVVACPCALVLASPITLVAGMGNAAKHGVMIKGGVHLERAGDIKQIVFDKTGTLTYGRPQVVHVWQAEHVESDSVQALTWALEQTTDHAVAKALKGYWSDGGSSPVTVHELTDIPGVGVAGEWDGKSVRLTHPRHVHESMGLPLPEAAQKWLQEGATVAILTVDESVWAAYGIRDVPRESADGGLSWLRTLGISSWMLTGDNHQSALNLASQLGIDEVRSNLLPEDKQRFVTKLAAQQPTAMVGDGINDGPALAVADLGIAMGGIGTDLALESADVVLMTDNLNGLEHLFSLGRKAALIVKQNIALSLGLKILALALVIPGMLTLWLAVIADMGASLLVTMNGLRLWRYRSRHSQTWGKR